MTEVSEKPNLDQFKTPMMMQYARIKSKYPDCLLFFRLGDFYELFLEDAEIGSAVLDITLTARHKGADGKIPMCGIPYHAIDNYLPKIVKAGYKAAICEQLSSETGEDKIVEREVVRIITSGTLLDEKLLNNKSNNFLALLSLNKDQTTANIVYTDLSTGQFLYKSINSKEIFESVKTELFKINPAEIILPSKIYENYEVLKIINQIGRVNISRIKNEITNFNEGLNTIYNYFKIKSVGIFDLNEKDESGIIAIANLLNYLFYTQKGNLFHIKEIKNLTNTDSLKLDVDTLRNLEIFESNKTSFRESKSNSLFETIDNTLTPMGARLLRSRLNSPFIDEVEINNRLNSLEKLAKNHKLREGLRDTIKNIKDIERILARIGTKTCNARDIKYLSNNIAVACYLLSASVSLELNKNEANYLLGLTELNNTQALELIESLNKIITKINITLTDEPPVTVREGGMIRDGVNAEVDNIKKGIEDSRLWIADLEGKEKEKTGISTLKVGFNSVFGYYIEISKANSKNVPDNYIRKQTLVNAERYITQELKEKEEIVLSAKDKIDAIEFKIFNELIEEVLLYVVEIQKIAKVVAEFDLISSFAKLAITNNYTKPEIFESEKYNLEIIEGRHPVVEVVVSNQNIPFTPNETYLTKNKFFHLITGPNMAGKSTYIRQVAILQIMAQIGCFVPAFEAKLSIVDGIYTRIGSGDALSQGLSTFMVEMIETAKILHNSTKNSLVILDEVGRGTSTIDGLCIARAIAEHIHNEIGCKTLFATHFHELISLEQRLKHLENYNVVVNEKDGEIRFLHKVEKGSTNKSYGIEVAKLAGIPVSVINRAKELLTKTDQKQIKFDL